MLSTIRLSVTATLLSATLALGQTAPTPAPPSFITGAGNFSHIVADLD